MEDLLEGEKHAGFSSCPRAKYGENGKAEPVNRAAGFAGAVPRLVWARGHPAVSVQWAARWQAEQDQRATARLTARQRGADAARAPLAAHFGREVFKKVHSPRG
eukprot:2980118-Pyramimonas_sp.AAC.2